MFLQNLAWLVATNAPQANENVWLIVVVVVIFALIAGLLLWLRGRKSDRVDFHID